jgi:hypothetical protein
MRKVSICDVRFNQDGEGILQSNGTRVYLCNGNELENITAVELDCQSDGVIKYKITGFLAKSGKLSILDNK